MRASRFPLLNADLLCALAKQGLATRRNQDAAGWQSSGMAEIQQQIVDFPLMEKTEVLKRALARQAGDILADARHRLELTLRSLQMPLAELDQRIRLFEENMIKIEEQRIVAMERLSADEGRLAASVWNWPISCCPGA